MGDPLETPASERPTPDSASHVGLSEVSILFLKLGFLAFGGPASHVALMEDEVVRRRGWMTREHFLDLLGAASLIPGPSSTELAIYIGYRLAGGAGLLLAGVCFILPAALMVSALAAMYVRWGGLPGVTALFNSLYPIVIAVVVQALWRLGRTAVKTPLLGIIAAGTSMLAFLGINPLGVLVAGGTAAAIAHVISRGRQSQGTGATASCLWTPLSSAPLATITTIGTATPFGLLPLFLVFLKFGAVIFGSGYVLLPFLQADLVGRRHWITERQLLDAIIIGQVTPGPVFTTATFIGYLLGRGRGAAVATIGIFLPAFCLVAINGPLVPRIRRSEIAGAFLDGLNVASLALMAVVTWQLGRAALDHEPLAWGILLCGTAFLLFTRINSLWLIAGAAIIGLAVARHT